MTKKQYIDELKKIAKKALKDVKSLTKENKFRVFDCSPHYSIYGGKLMKPEIDKLKTFDIFDNVVKNYPHNPELFVYTEEELDNIKKNDATEKIKAYEESIRMHQGSIDRYKEQIQMIKDCKK